MQTPSEILGADGPLAAHIEGFSPRPQQQAMAEAVTRALGEETVLIAEAGTGTGKTFAYLVPALLSGKKVIVSTGTKNLQDQLFHRDLPVVREALGVPVQVALLKGRANYLCHHRLAVQEAEGAYRSREQSHQLRLVREWSGRTKDGDIAGLTGIAEDAPLWPLVTSTADNCLGQDCDYLNDCFVSKARRAAQEAEVVVVNHHLFFADLALKDGGFGELLPGANAFIMDEAHQLPEVAANFFGLTLGSRQLDELARDSLEEHLREAGDMGEIAAAGDALKKAVADLRLALGRQPRRGAWREVAGYERVGEAVAALHKALSALRALLEQAAPRGKGLAKCKDRCVDLVERLELLTAPNEGEYIHWFETFTRSFTLTLTPLDIGQTFRGHLEAHPSAWVFTSATLAVGDSFDHFAGRLGLPEEADTLRVDSPFDYDHNALMYLPTALPEPNHPDYTAAVVEAAVPVLEASQGRAFLLFTSHRALREAAELLAGRLPYPLMVQGDAPRGELLERFRDHGNAILLGTSSFWEGVDVRGEALSLVIIDKLPFASPGDPVLQARIDAMRRAGGNPFMDYQLPAAVIALKQGAGRLIRDVSDRGVMMLCDPRLLSKAYGRVFLASLPPMHRTRAVEEVQAFFVEGGE